MSAISMLVSGLISSLFNDISSARNFRYQKMQAEEQYKYGLKMMSAQQALNERNMDIQNSYNERAWQRMVDYNDPSAVRERYEQAGIAPQAALGGGVTNAGLATLMESPTSSNPQAQGVHMNGNYMALASLESLATINAQEALADKYRADADSTRSETFDKEFNMWLKRSEGNLRNTLSNLYEQNRLTDVQRERVFKADADLREATKDSNIEAADAAAKTKIAELFGVILDNEHKKFDNDHQKEEFYADLNKTIAETLVLRSQASLNSVMAMKEAELANVARAEFRKLSLEGDELEAKLGMLRAEIKAQMPYLDEKARLQVEALAAQNFRTLVEAEAAKTNAKANLRRVNHEVWQNWIKTACNVAGTVATYGMGGSFVKSSSVPTIYGAGGNVIGPQGQLQGWNK